MSAAFTGAVLIQLTLRRGGCRNLLLVLMFRSSVYEPRPVRTNLLTAV